MCYSLCLWQYFLFHILYHEYMACVFTFSCFLSLLLKGKTKLFQCCVGCLNSLPDLCTKWIGLSVLEVLDSRKSYFQQQCSLTLNLFFKMSRTSCELRLTYADIRFFILLQDTLKLEDKVWIINWFHWVIMDIVLHRLVWAEFAW